MREVERLRERQKLSLGDRQVVALTLCALLLLSGVFALGVLVGKRSVQPPPPAAAGDLAGLDAQARAPVHAPPPAPEAMPRPPEPPAAAVEKPEVRAATVVPAAVHTPVVVPAPKPSLAADVPLAPPPRDPGSFTVQVGASQDRGEAARIVNRARGAGLRPYVVQANLGAKGTWYRIRVGAFHDKDAAARFRKDVERELRVAAVVMPTH